MNGCTCHYEPLFQALVEPCADPSKTDEPVRYVVEDAEMQVIARCDSPGAAHLIAWALNRVEDPMLRVCPVHTGTVLGESDED